MPDSPAPSATGEAWDLLWISDSTGMGGAQWLYADRIREDVGVEVDVTDGWMPGQDATMILDTLRGRNDGVLTVYTGTIDLAQEIRDAEVIMVSGNPGPPAGRRRPLRHRLRAECLPAARRRIPATRRRGRRTRRR